MTSILRTYYIWETIKSPDYSYNLFSVGVWSNAEIAIGIIVSCLPVFPKFFRHIGPKIHATFTIESLSGTLYRHKMWYTGNNTDKTHSSFGNGRPSFKRSGHKSIQRTWNGSNHSKAELKGQFIALDESEMLQPKFSALGGFTPTLANGPATIRGDLEYGICYD